MAKRAAVGLDIDLGRARASARKAGDILEENLSGAARKSGKALEGALGKKGAGAIGQQGGMAFAAAFGGAIGAGLAGIGSALTKGGLGPAISETGKQIESLGSLGSRLNASVSGRIGRIQQEAVHARQYLYSLFEEVDGRLSVDVEKYGAAQVNLDRAKKRGKRLSAQFLNGFANGFRATNKIFDSFIGLISRSATKVIKFVPNLISGILKKADGKLSNGLTRFLARAGGNIAGGFTAMLAPVLKAVGGGIQKFGAGLTKVVSAGRKGLAGLARGFTAIGTVVAVGVTAVAAMTAAFVKFGMRGVQAFRDVSDARASLENSLRGVGSDIGVERFEALANNLSMAAGAAPSEVMAGASSFINSGYDAAATENLSKLAAGIVADPKSRIKSYEEAVSTLQDVMNGSTDAAKRLGIYVKSGGGSAEEYAAAMGQVQNQLYSMYGGISTELVNPSQQLAGTWERVQIVVGEYLEPAFNRVLSYVNEILVGMEQGQLDLTMQEVAENAMRAAEFIINVIRKLPAAWDLVSGFFKNVFNSISWIEQTVLSLIAKAMAFLNEMLEKALGPKISKMLGLDRAGSMFRELEKAYGEGAEKAGKAALAASEQMKSGLSDLFDPKSDLDAIREEGRNAIREAETAASKLDNGVSLVGDGAKEEYERRLAAQREQFAALQAQVQGYGVSGNDRLIINFKTTSPDRFRRTEFRRR